MMEVTFGTKTYKVSALNWRQLDELQADIAAMVEMKGMFFSADNAEARKSTFKVIMACIKRVHEDVSDDYVRDNLDLANIGEAIAAVLGANGFKKGQPGEAPAAASPTST